MISVVISTYDWVVVGIELAHWEALEEMLQRVHGPGFDLIRGWADHNLIVHAYMLSLLLSKRRNPLLFTCISLVADRDVHDKAPESASRKGNWILSRRQRPYPRVTTPCNACILLFWRVEDAFENASDNEVENQFISVDTTERGGCALFLKERLLRDSVG